VGHDGVVRAMPIDSRDQRWEDDSPAYRVCFWQLAGGRSEEWELTEADVAEVLAWADAHAGDRTVSVWVVHQDAAGLGAIRLAGIDPTTDPGAWPSWASARPD